MDKIAAIYEQQAAEAFSRQSAYFDQQYADNTIVHYKRMRVRHHLLALVAPGSRILELNAGTGEDAIYFAQRGYRVHATDISTGMQARLRIKVERFDLQKEVTQEICSYSKLDELHDRGPYDCIFSNFAGLNCAGDLEPIFSRFSKLLSPGGKLVLVMLPRFCLWETMLLLKGKWNTAFRRFFSRNGRQAKIDGNHFRCWYYNPGEVRRLLGKDFHHLKTEGLCTFVPPSYIEYFAERHPRVYANLCSLEEKMADKWPFKNIGDYYIISFQKRED